MSKNQKKIDKAKKKAEEQAAVEDFLKETNKAEVPADETEEKLDVKYIKCPKCGADMPVTIQTCINCGAKIKEKSSYKMISEKKARAIRWSIGIVLVLGFAIWYIISILA